MAARRGGVLAKIVVSVVAIAAAGGIAWAVWQRLAERGDGGRDRGERGPVPVEVSDVEVGPIELRRTFSGTLEPWSTFTVAPEVSGRIERLAVDLADPVARRMIVAELDDAEFAQAVAVAEADLAVAEAELSDANTDLDKADKDLSRLQTLFGRGVVSETQLDTAVAEQNAATAAVQVAAARRDRAAAALRTAEIRRAYTDVVADWRVPGEADLAATRPAATQPVTTQPATTQPAGTQPAATQPLSVLRFVAERYVDEGDTVAANAALLRVVQLDPIRGVIFVTERDYAALQPGQLVTLRTDAYPGETFDARVTRIAPVFRAASRQARVELEADNRDGRLKPGMFVRAEVVLDRAARATVVPEEAVVRRGGVTGLFVLTEDGERVVWREVAEGIRNAGRVAVTGEGISGRVVTLGQQLLSDGATITIPDEDGATRPAATGPVEAGPPS